MRNSASDDVAVQYKYIIPNKIIRNGRIGTSKLSDR